MTGISPAQARANTEAASRSTEAFIVDIDQAITLHSERGEFRVIVTLPRALTREGQAEALLNHYQSRGYVVEQLSVTGHAWTLQIGW